MKNRRKVCLSILLFFLSISIPYANGFEETVYLCCFYDFNCTGRNRVTYEIDLKEGDILYWRFTTYDNEFEVSVAIFGVTEGVSGIVSENKTTDSGSFTAQADHRAIIYFDNTAQECLGGGWIRIELSINAPLPVISGYDILIVIPSIIFGILIILLGVSISKYSIKA